MGNVVIVTHWLDGDVIPFVRIGKELKRRGHEVTLITHCHFESMAQKAGLNFRAWDTPEEYRILVDNMQQNKSDNSSANHYSYSESEFRQKYESIEVRLKEYKIISECCDKPNTAILCKNRSSIAAYMVAEKRRLPLATVMMNPTEVASMLLYEQLEGHNDLPRLNELRADVNLPAVDSWLQWESSAKMTLALWPQWYDEIDDQWPASIETVGFPFEEGKDVYRREIPEDFTSWLNHNPNPIVITGGTTKCINERFYTSSIAACALLGQPTVVLSQYDEFLPKELPPNVKRYRYLPLDQIMSHVRVLIHHGGMGTLTGALAAGIPQLILPCYVARPYKATLIKKLGAGDYLLPVNWQAEKIAEMVRSLETAGVADNCCRFISRMQANCGVSVAADRVEQLLNNDSYIYGINLRYTPAVKPRGEYDPDAQKKSSVEKLQNLSSEQRSKLLLNLRKRGNANRTG